MRTHRRTAPALALLVSALSFTSSGPAGADEADALYRKGMGRMQQGKLDEAEEALKQAIQQRPGGYAAAELPLGNVLRKKGQCDKALPHYEAVLRVQPTE